MTDFKARPTVYKGIKMRSRLEAGFAAWLDECGFEWEYEPCAFGSERGQYLPDFRVRALRASWKPEPVVAYIEVKPASWNPVEVDDEEADIPDVFAELTEQMALVWESEPGAICLLVQQGRGVAYLRMQTEFKRPWPWFFEALWVMGPEPTGRVPTWDTGRPMVAIPVYPEQQPWPDGYWKVGPR